VAESGGGSARGRPTGGQDPPGAGAGDGEKHEHDGHEQVQAEEAREELQEAAERHFQRRSALVIALLAMLLAINALGSSNAGADQTLSTIQAANTWAFFLQAKNIRQTDYELAADDLEVFLPSLPPAQQADARGTIDRYRATAARYESEPDAADPTNPLKGEGMKELTAIARDHEARRDRASEQQPNFDLAGSAYQIAIVLGSVAILSASRRLLGLCVALGAVATVLMLNGFFLVVPLPGG
jgi:hypothetical protein